MAHPNRNKVKNWPAHLKAFRAKKGISQKILADKLQISLRTVENWEVGFTTPPEFLKKALRYMDEVSF